MVQCILFDVGSVLFNDDRQSFLVYDAYFRRIVQQNPHYRFEELLVDRERSAKVGERSILRSLVRHYLTADEISSLEARVRPQLLREFDQSHLSAPQLEATLKQLSSRYRLGLLANQPPECLASLRRRGLDRYFDILGISEIVGLSKPDPAFFEWALNQAQVPAHEVVMVGDRVDNDIKPAQKLGMKTVLMREARQELPGWAQDNANAQLFISSLERVPQFFEGEQNTTRADAQISQLHQLPAVLRSWDDLKNQET